MRISFLRFLGILFFLCHDKTNFLPMISEYFFLLFERHFFLLQDLPKFKINRSGWFFRPMWWIISPSDQTPSMKGNIYHSLIICCNVCYGQIIHITQIIYKHNFSASIIFLCRKMLYWVLLYKSNLLHVACIVWRESTIYK